MRCTDSTSPSLYLNPASELKAQKLAGPANAWRSLTQASTSGREISARGSRAPKIGGKLIDVKTLGTWLLTLLLAVTCALPAAIAPSGTTKGDATRAAFNLPLRSSRRPSRALPFEENLRSLSLQGESAPSRSFERVSDARHPGISRLSLNIFPLATVTCVPLALLCRLRI
jgi:hypothetical protein